MVRGGSVSGGSEQALCAADGAKAVAEGAMLEARPAEGVDSSAVLAHGLDSRVVLQRCKLRVPPVCLQPARAPGSEHNSLEVWGGARATAADCTCSGRVHVDGQGSALLHSGLAFPPGLVDPIFEQEGGLAREVPGAAGGAGGAGGLGGSRAAAPAPAVAPPGAGTQGAGSALVAAAEAAESARHSAGTGASGPAGEAAAVVDGLGYLALGGA